MFRKPKEPGNECDQRQVTTRMDGVMSDDVMRRFHLRWALYTVSILGVTLAAFFVFGDPHAPATSLLPSVVGALAAWLAIAIGGYLASRSL